MSSLNFETTGRLAESGSLFRIAARVLTVIALGFAASPGAGAADLRISLSNDMISGSRQPDDLYTAEVSFEVDVLARAVRFGERMFTRRDLGKRFDETYLDVRLGEWERNGWHLAPRLGVLRVGAGLLGEQAQNDIHDLVGADPVDLSYVDDSRWYGSAELAAERPTPSCGAWWTPWLEVSTIPGFRNSARVGLRFERDLPGDVGLRIGAGAVVNQVQEELLKGAVRESGPLAEVGIGWRGAHLRFAYNDYGTRGNTVTLGVDPLKLRAAGRGR